MLIKKKEGRFNKARKYIQKNTCQRIQRFYRKHLDQKEDINDRKERIWMDVQLYFKKNYYLFIHSLKCESICIF